MLHVVMVMIFYTFLNGHKKACHLYGIDIQMKAIKTSKELLQSNDIAPEVSLTFIHDSHDFGV